MPARKLFAAFCPATRVDAQEEDDDIYKIMFGDDAPHSMVAMLAGAEQAL
jgi:hypothetical protein